MAEWLVRRSYLRARFLQPHLQASGNVRFAQPSAVRRRSTSNAPQLVRLEVRTTLARHEQSGKQKSYLNLLHSFLHAADAAVHCATHAPDSPQFCAQEKLFELQFDTHSATVWFCASRSLSTNVLALLSVIPDISNRSTIMYLMASSPRGSKRSGRCLGVLDRLVRLRDSGLRKDRHVHAIRRSFRSRIWP
jgi:hypothetical protein